jgi:hypothetical protein
MLNKTINYLKDKILRVATSKLLKRRVLWNIALFNLEDLNLASITHKNPIKIFTSKKLQFRTSHIEFIADPFLFVHDDELFLFFEEKQTTSKGYIKAYKTNDLKLWKDCGIILKEKFHLSYPNVFKVGVDIFMIPEAAESQKILLYKSINFPYDWIVFHELIPFNGRFVDSSIYLENGIYYLFTTEVLVDNSGNRGYKLLLYYSESLTDQWVEHPASPLSEDMKNARGAGSIFKFNNKLYRPAQDCSDIYGENYSIYEITALTITEYTEKMHIEDMVNFNHKWSALCGHHFNLVKFKDMTIAVTDGLQNDYRLNIFFNIVVKSANKIAEKF